MEITLTSNTSSQLTLATQQSVAKKTWIENQKTWTFQIIVSSIYDLLL